MPFHAIYHGYIWSSNGPALRCGAHPSNDLPRTRRHQGGQRQSGLPRRPTGGPSPLRAAGRGPGAGGTALAGRVAETSAGAGNLQRCVCGGSCPPYGRWRPMDGYGKRRGTVVVPSPPANGVSHSRPQGLENRRRTVRALAILLPRRFPTAPTGPTTSTYIYFSKSKERSEWTGSPPLHLQHFP